MFPHEYTLNPESASWKVGTEPHRALILGSIWCHGRQRPQILTESRDSCDITEQFKTESLPDKFKNQDQQILDYKEVQ